LTTKILNLITHNVLASDMVWWICSKENVW